MVGVSISYVEALDLHLEVVAPIVPHAVPIPKAS